MKNRMRLSTVLTISLTTVLLTALTHCYFRWDKEFKIPNEAQQIQAPKEGVVTGLSINEYSEGRKLFTLRVEAVKIYRKKVGAFRLGFWKIARLEKVHIEFYAPPCDEQIDPGQQNGSDGPYLSQPIAVKTEDGGPDFGEYLSNIRDLKALQLKGVKGIEIDKIQIHVNQTNNRVSSISADKAKFNPGNKSFTFEGSVKIKSADGRSLECRKICWHPETKKFKTSGHYVARLEDRTLEGRVVETDYLLKELNFGV